MQRYGSIYKITNLINGKVYIGQTTASVKARWKNHKGAVRAGRLSGVIHKAIAKYGHTAFSVEEVAVCSTKDALDIAEQRLIDTFGSMTPAGYNLREGGAHGLHSEETKRKMSQTRKGREVPAEQRAKIAQAHRGKKFSEQHRANLSKARKGKPQIASRVPIVDQNGTYYPAVFAAAKQLGIPRQSIAGVLNGRSPSTRGYTFYYLHINPLKETA